MQDLTAWQTVGAVILYLVWGITMFVFGWICSQIRTLVKMSNYIDSNEYSKLDNEGRLAVLDIIDHMIKR